MGMNGFILIDINRKISKIFRKPISRTFTLQDCCAAGPFLRVWPIALAASAGQRLLAGPGGGRLAPGASLDVAPTAELDNHAIALSMLSATKQP